jgi:hypothetical protein
LNSEWPNRLAIFQVTHGFPKCIALSTRCGPGRPALLSS